MNRPSIAVLLLSLSTLFACSGSDEAGPDDVSEQATVQTAQPQQTLELSWEQLMPKGEEAVLEKLYSDYYANLENQMVPTAQDGADPGAVTADDLVAAIVEGSAVDTMEQIGTFNVVKELDGRKIRLPGYVVPFDFSADSNFREFLLVPYFGACLHTPPPPPNQIVYVKADPGVTIANIYEPVWVEGVLKTGEFNSDLGDSAYELSLNSLEAYVY